MRYLISCMLIFFVSVTLAQDTNLDSPEVKNSSVEFNGTKYSGYLIEFNASPEIVEEAIKERFKLQGIKPKETKGFMVYRNVVIPRIDPVKPMDAFIKVERKSRKEKEQTIVYFIAALPGEIAEDKLRADGSAKSTGVNAIEKGGAFLTGLIPDVKKGVYDKDVANRQSLLKKEEKKLENLLEDQTEMEKKLKKLQSDIEYNKKAQERQIADIEKSKNELNALMTKNPSK